jgi:hypothetical protein
MLVAAESFHLDLSTGSRELVERDHPVGVATKTIPALAQNPGTNMAGL